MKADCDRQRPDEACGLLLGKAKGEDVRVLRLSPTPNVWPQVIERPHRFAIDPLTQLKAEQAAAAEGMALVGFYHSHPTALAVPSEFDRGRAWPKYVYVILGYAEPAGPTPRAWVLDDGGAFVEHPIRIDETISEE